MTSTEAQEISLQKAMEIWKTSIFYMSPGDAYCFGGNDTLTAVWGYTVTFAEADLAPITKLSSEGITLTSPE